VISRALPAAALDAIAQVLTSDRLRPFQPAPQMFPLGDASTFGIRADYRARRVEVTSQPQRHSGVQVIAEDIARALDMNVVDTSTLLAALFERSGEEPATAQRSVVLVCDDILQRVNDPAEVLNRMRVLAADGSVVLLSAPLRSLADGSLGPPEDVAIAREWTFPELQACLDQFDFEPLFGGLLMTAVQSADIGVIVAIAQYRAL
jgi:hypothetical protein